MHVSLCRYRTGTLHVSVTLATGPLQGLSAKSGVTISIQAANSAVGASATLAVSNDPVCLASLDAQATTGVRFLSAPKPVAGSSINGSWEARQDLTWEDSSAYVLTYATFSDGAIMDVSTQVGPCSSTVSHRDPDHLAGMDAWNGMLRGCAWMVDYPG